MASSLNVLCLFLFLHQLFAKRALSQSSLAPNLQCFHRHRGLAIIRLNLMRTVLEIISIYVILLLFMLIQAFKFCSLMTMPGFQF